MLPPKKDEPGYAEYREQYALCDQSQLVDYATVDIPASSTANNVIGARSTRIMFPTIAFPPMSPFQGPRPILETAFAAVNQTCCRTGENEKVRVIPRRPNCKSLSTST